MDTLLYINREQRFSSMTIDQAHEQANAVFQADGGGIGVTALRSWMIAGSEVTHYVAQYEAACGTKVGNEHPSH